MKGNGKMIQNTVKVFSLTQVELNMMVIFWMIKNMEWVFISMPMEENMKDNGHSEIVVEHEMNYSNLIL